MLHGDQVTLRPMERDDIPRLWEFAQDMNLGLVTGADGRPTSRAAVERYYDERWSGLDPTAVRWGIESHGVLIGGAELTDLDWRNRSATLKVWIGDSAYRRHGCGSDAIRVVLSYAFRILGLHRVAFLAEATNEGVVECYTRSGFTEEGRLREAHYADGRYHDVLALAVLREDWTDDTPLRTSVKVPPAASPPG